MAASVDCKQMQWRFKGFHGKRQRNLAHLQQFFGLQGNGDENGDNGTPKGNRTPVPAVRGRCPDR
jgi:hypothetical protein